MVRSRVRNYLLRFGDPWHRVSIDNFDWISFAQQKWLSEVRGSIRCWCYAARRQGATKAFMWRIRTAFARLRRFRVNFELGFENSRTQTVVRICLFESARDFSFHIFGWVHYIHYNFKNNPNFGSFGAESSSSCAALIVLSALESARWEGHKRLVA